MKTSHFALIIGLFLGAILAFGTFFQFFLVVLFGLIGLGIGYLLEGKIEIQGLTDRWKK